MGELQKIGSDGQTNLTWRTRIDDCIDEVNNRTLDAYTIITVSQIGGSSTNLRAVISGGLSRTFEGTSAVQDAINAIPNDLNGHDVRLQFTGGTDASPNVYQFDRLQFVEFYGGKLDILGEGNNRASDFKKVILELTNVQGFKIIRCNQINIRGIHFKHLYANSAGSTESAYLLLASTVDSLAYVEYCVFEGNKINLAASTNDPNNFGIYSYYGSNVTNYKNRFKNIEFAIGARDGGVMNSVYPENCHNSTEAELPRVGIYSGATGQNYVLDDRNRKIIGIPNAENVANSATEHGGLVQIGANGSSDQIHSEDSVTIDVADNTTSSATDKANADFIFDGASGHNGTKPQIGGNAKRLSYLIDKAFNIGAYERRLYIRFAAGTYNFDDIFFIGGKNCPIFVYTKTDTSVVSNTEIATTKDVIINFTASAPSNQGLLFVDCNSQLAVKGIQFTSSNDITKTFNYLKFLRCSNIDVLGCAFEHIGSSPNDRHKGIEVVQSSGQIRQNVFMNMQNGITLYDGSRISCDQNVSGATFGKTTSDSYYWQSDHSYVDGREVGYNGKIYKAQVNITSGESAPDSNSNWSETRSSIPNEPVHAMTVMEGSMTQEYYQQEANFYGSSTHRRTRTGGIVWGFNDYHKGIFTLDSAGASPLYVLTDENA